MNSQKLVLRNPDLIAADLDGDTVMMDVESGHYFSLNSVGSYVWAALEDPSSKQSIIDKVLLEFEVSEADSVAADVSKFLQELLENGLIQEVPG